MVIDNYIKCRKVSKRGQFYYMEFSDGCEYKIEPEIYLKYNLSNSPFTIEQFHEIVNENTFKLCLNSALRLLTIRLHSENEIKMKLTKRSFERDCINKVLIQLREMSLLDDEFFVENYILELIAGSKGRYKIIQALRKRGISKELIDNALTQFIDADSEELMAIEVMLRKVNSLSYLNLEPRKLKEKVIRHLISKGFPTSIVFKIIENI